MRLWSCSIAGTLHLYCVSGEFTPLDIAEQLRTTTLSNFKEEMEISVVFEIVPGLKYIIIYHLYNRRHLAYMYVPSIFNVPTTLAEDGLLLDTEHP